VSRLFVGNFDFESGLKQPGRTRSIDERRRNLELSFAWLSVAKPGDAILVDALPPPEFLNGLPSLGRKGVRFVTDPPDEPLSLVPWGWNQDIVQWADDHDLIIHAPPLDVVALANRRAFSVHREIEWQVGLEGQAVCDSVASVRTAVAPLDRWLIKSQYGASGRDRLNGQRSHLTLQQIQWIERHLEIPGQVFVEPLVDCILEVGYQWVVPDRPELDPKLVAVVPLLTDARGQYEGSRFTPLPELPAACTDMIEVTRRVATELQRLGYFGPLGIDAMLYRDSSGIEQTRPLQDVNARWTMGRLAFEWTRPPNENRFVSFRRSQLSDTAEAAPHGTLTIFPQSVGGIPIRHQFLLELQRAVNGPESSLEE
jgi:hypothetical protein